MRRKKQKRIKDSLTWKPEMLERIRQYCKEKRLSRSIAVEYMVECFFKREGKK